MKKQQYELISRPISSDGKVSCPKCNGEATVTKLDETKVKLTCNHCGDSRELPIPKVAYEIHDATE